MGRPVSLGALPPKSVVGAVAVIIRPPRRRCGSCAPARRCRLYGTVEQGQGRISRAPERREDQKNAITARRRPVPFTSAAHAGKAHVPPAAESQDTMRKPRIRKNPGFKYLQRASFPPGPLLPLYLLTHGSGSRPWAAAIDGYTFNFTIAVIHCQSIALL